MAPAQIGNVIQELRRDAYLRDSGELSDAQLLERFLAQRDEAAFAALVRRHGAMVWGVCRRVATGYHDAEDAFQATFLVLVHKARSIRMRELLANWLYGVAYRTARRTRIAGLRRQSREKLVADVPEPPIDTVESRADVRELIDRELNALPAKYRLPMVLCELEGKTHQETADQLGWPVGTVSGRLSRARQILARRLAQRGVEASAAAWTALLLERSASAGPTPTLLTAAFRCAGSVPSVEGAPLVSADVTALTLEVLRTMWLDKLKLRVALLAPLLLCTTMTIFGLAANTIPQPADQAGTSAVDNQEQPPAAGDANKAGAPNNQPGAAGKISDGWQLNAKLESDSVAAGDAVRLTLTLRNTTKGKLVYGESSPGFDYLRALSVTNEKGKEVPRTHFGARWLEPAEFTKFVTRTLLPGQQVKTTLNLALAFDLTGAGAYTITARHPFVVMPGQFLGGKEAVVVSNPVQVKITFPAIPSMQVEDVLHDKIMSRLSALTKGSELPKKSTEMPKSDPKLFEKRLKELDGKPILEVIGEESITALRLMGDPPGKGMKEHPPDTYVVALRTGTIVPELKATSYNLKTAHECLIETTRGNYILRIYYEPVGYLLLPNGESYWLLFGERQP